MRKISIFLFIFAMAFSAAARNEFNKEIFFGVKGGGTYSKVRFYPNVEQAFNSGYTGGLVFRMISEPHVGIQCEVNYSQKGWKENFEPDGDYLRRLTYVDVPLMTHINIGKRGFRFFLNIGPSISFLISEEETYTPSRADVPEISERDYFDQPVDNTIDFQFTAGLGMELRLKNGNALVLDGRLYQSLPNLFDSDTYQYDSSQNQIAEITLGYQFSLSRKNKTQDKKKVTFF